MYESLVENLRYWGACFSVTQRIPNSRKDTKARNTMMTRRCQNEMC